MRFLFYAYGYRVGSEARAFTLTNKLTEESPKLRFLK